MFNHIGLCVTDLERSRNFYEQALGFSFWWELEAPEESSVLLQLDTPLELHAVYLLNNDFVLELLGYHPDRLEQWRHRSMAEPGLTHISVSVADIDAAIERVEQFGGEAIPETHVGVCAMVRDPDGQLIELVAPGWRESRPPMPE